MYADYLLKMRTKFPLSVFCANVVLIACASVLGFASHAHASTYASVHQVLPPIGQTCPSLKTSDIHFYIYDAKVHSFDVSLSDDSYVAVAGSIGETALPFMQMTRWRNSDGSLRIHVDTPALPLSKPLSIRIVLLSAHTGVQRATCLAVLSAVAPAVHMPFTMMPDHQQKTNERESYESIHPLASSTTITQEDTAIPVVTTTHSVGNLCATAEGAKRLWIVLFVLYVLFIIALVVQKKSSSYVPTGWDTVLLLGVYLSMLLFWYFSSSCRAGTWVPILMTIITGAGLFVVGYTDNTTQSTPLLTEPSPQQQKILLEDKNGVDKNTAL